MKARQPKPADELRMSSKEFDRIMGQALQVKPDNKADLGRAAKPKRNSKKNRLAGK